jgi:hypothetical protein
MIVDYEILLDGKFKFEVKLVQGVNKLYLKLWMKDLLHLIQLNSSFDDKGVWFLLISGILQGYIATIIIEALINILFAKLQTQDLYL